METTEDGVIELISHHNVPRVIMFVSALFLYLPLISLSCLALSFSHFVSIIPQQLQ